MKFNLGHWMIKPNIQAKYAVEYYESRREGSALHIVVPTGHLAHRRRMSPALFVTLTSPMEGVIGVTAAHFKGGVKHDLRFDLNAADVDVKIEETDEYIDYTSGSLTARVNKGASQWGIEFIQDGRTLTASGLHALGYFTDTETGKKYMQEALDLGVGETVYGLGERFTPFVRNGQAIDMWQADGGTCSELAYKNIPFYLTNRGYGVFVDNPGEVMYEVGSENVERVQFAVEDEALTYYLIAGPKPLDVVSRYTALTGRPAMPPEWSFGLWLSTSFTTQYDEKTVTSFIQGMEDRDIPLSVFHFDCCWMKPFHWCDFEWDGAVFPDPEGMLKRYKARGLHICVWINPYIAQASSLFDEAVEKGYLVRRTDGSVWQSDLWQAGMGIVDFTNPEACRWYQSHLRRLIGQGVDCFKTDFAERIPVRDIAWHDGSDPICMHNYYTQLYNEVVFSLIEEEKGKGEAIVFARSATAGGQKMPVHWGGDNSASYVSMAETLRGGLSLSASGFGFWSHDIGGFEATAPADVYKRWCAFGLMSSHSRLHGSSSYRVPWLFDEEAVDVLRFFVKLKLRMMPYLLKTARQAHEKGYPTTRPMFMAFPDDPACDPLDRQYMLGDDLLVAPVFTKEGTVDYYLPAGKWTHLLDGRVEEGGRWMRDKCNFFEMPLWVREGGDVFSGE